MYNHITFIFKHKVNDAFRHIQNMQTLSFDEISYMFPSTKQQVSYPSSLFIILLPIYHKDFWHIQSLQLSLISCLLYNKPL